jgi:hypothetical protein
MKKSGGAGTDRVRARLGPPREGDAARDIILVASTHRSDRGPSDGFVPRSSRQRTPFLDTHWTN